MSIEMQICITYWMHVWAATGIAASAVVLYMPHSLLSFWVHVACLILNVFVFFVQFVIRDYLRRVVALREHLRRGP